MLSKIVRQIKAVWEKQIKASLLIWSLCYIKPQICHQLIWSYLDIFVPKQICVKSVQPFVFDTSVNSQQI